MTIGQRIHNRRVELGLSVDELAEKLGKNRATIYRYESNAIKGLPVSVLEGIAAALQTTPADLMGIEENETYYVDDTARELAEFLHKNPEYRVLFDASRNVKPEDIAFVKELIDKMTK